MEPTNVLIVGAGPTGLAMGIELARQGVPFRMVEKAPEPAKWSQALVVQARTLEQFERYGIAEEAVARGRTLHHAEMVSEGRTIISFPFDRIPGRYPFVLFLPQSETERLMAEHLAAIGGRVERGVELVSFVNGPEGVEATLRHADGRTEVGRFRWIVGCDGAHSTVRHGLGVPFEGDTVGLSFLLGDLELEGEGVPGDEIRIYLHRGDVVFFGRLGERVWRVILVEHGRDWEKGTPGLGDFQRMIDAAVGPGIRVVGSEWVSPYHVNQRKARHYRVGSAFLAGDACHIHSPVAGQGMNTGIQDAANLGWKLGAVMRDGAPDELLDTYETERGAVGEALLWRTSRGLELATVEGRVAEWVRDLVARVATSVPWVRDALVGFISETAIWYPESPVVVDCSGDGKVLAGDRVPNPDVAGGRLLDGLKGGRQLFLMGMRGGPVEVQGEPWEFEAVDVSREELRRVVGGEGQILVVRPDGYAGFRGRPKDRAALEEYARMTGLERKHEG